MRRLVIALTVLAAGCQAAAPPSARSAPVLEVVTGLYPLAEAASEIGGAKVRVSDVVPPGADPYTYRPDPAAVGAAGLVLVSAGLQPALEAAATRPVVVGPYAWLDPPAMEQAAGAITAAMERADPNAAPVYRQGEEAYSAELRSLDEDFSATLAACPGRDIIAPDTALAGLAGSYGRRLHVATASQVPALAALVKGSSPVAVLTEPWEDDTAVEAVAAAASVKARSMDTLASSPPAGHYLDAMESDLATLSAALGCPDGEQ